MTILFKFFWLFQKKKQSDEKLKGVDTKYLDTHNEEVETVKKALEGKKYIVNIVEDEKEALEQIKKSIPSGSSVYSAGSTTLAEVGLVDYLKGETPYNNIKAKILAEKDQQKIGSLYAEAFTADYFLSSVGAVSHEGEFIVSDATGTRVAGFTAAKNVLVVVGLYPQTLQFLICFSFNSAPLLTLFFFFKELTSL